MVLIMIFADSFDRTKTAMFVCLGQFNKAPFPPKEAEVFESLLMTHFLTEEPT